MGKYLHQITELSEVPANGDLVLIQDVSDTTDSANGTTKRITYGNLTSDLIGLTDLSVGSEASASGNGAIAYNSSTGVFTYTPPTAAGISAAAASHTHATSDITSGTFADARIAQSNVTQHQAALSITESQISDLGNYITLTDLSVGAEASASGNGALSYNNSTGVFTYTPPTLAGLNGSIDDLTDVTLTSTATNDILRWNGSTFVNTDAPTLDALQFDLTAAETAAVGQLAWNSEDLTLDLGLDTNVTLQIGQEQLARIKAASAIRNGMAVYVSGVTGGSDNLEGTPFSADSASGVDELRFLGIATEALSTNAVGFVTTFGKVRGVNGTTYASGGIRDNADTESWSVGDILYASPNIAGTLTSVVPTAPDRQMPIAIVLKLPAETNITLFVRAEHGYHLNELHDVLISGTPADNELLAYDSASGNWINQTAAEAGIITASSTDNLTNKTFSDHITVAEIVAPSTPSTGFGAIYAKTDGKLYFKNDAGTETDLTAAGGGGGSGTVTSVDMSVPTGFAISGNPITTSGTLALAFDTGYSLPTTASQTNWNTAYGWGDHSTAGYLTDITGENLSSLSDVTITSIASGELIKWNGSAWINNTLAEAGIAATGHTHSTSDITSGTFADARIAQSNVTQHQAALSITESQISDLGSYITASSTDILTNKTFDANGTGNSLSNVETADIASGSKSGSDITLITGTAGTDGNVVTWNADGDAVDSGYAVSAFVGGVNYQGTWNASTNSPTIPAASSGNKGYYYKVSVAGSTSVDGETDWKVGDWIISNGTTWDKVDNTESVSSVFGRTGAVTASFSDISGTATHEQGGLEADVSGYSGLVKISGGATSQVTDNSTNWNTAYGWGDHSVAGYLTDITGENLSTLADVTITSIASGEVLKWSGSAWINNTLAEAGIAAASHNHATSDITSGTFADARIAESNVTQHQAALSITESQISDLGSYITASSTDNLTNKTFSDHITVAEIAAPSTPSTGFGAIYAKTDGKIYFKNDAGTETDLTAGAGAGSGTVTSVDMTVPTGFAISGNPITSSGTLALAFDTGYSLPTTAKQTNWDTAYGWGDHSVAGYLTDITGENLSTLADVTITSIASGEILKWSGSAWINNTLAEAGIATLTGTENLSNKTFDDLITSNGLCGTPALTTGSTTAAAVFSSGQNGGSLGGNTGTARFESGESTSGDSGNVFLTSGDSAGGGNTGSVTIGTGSCSASGAAGDIILDPGTDGAGSPPDRGDVIPNGVGVINFGTASAPWLACYSYTAAFVETGVGTNYVAFTAPSSIASDVTWTLPNADGSSGQVLSTNGSGTLSWATVSGGGGISNVVEDTTPQLGGQLDVNGNAIGDGTLELLTFTEDASAVNHINIENEATGSGPIVSAAGDDTNIDLNLRGKATGNVIVSDGTDVTKTLSFELSGATTSTKTTLTASQTAARTITLPDATDTLVGKATTDTFTNKTFDANGTGNSLSNVETADIASGSKSGSDTTLVTGTAGTNGNLVSWNADGDAVDSSIVASNVALTDGDTYTGTHDFGGATLEIPNGAAPSLSVAGQIALDTSTTDHTALLKYHDGTNEFVIPAILSSGLSTTDNDVIAYNAANNRFEMEAQSGSGGGISNVVEDSTPQLGGQLDVNGNAIGDGTLELLTFTEDASAVNHVNIENEATGSGPIISAAGDDTNIDLNLSAKGTGNISLGNITFDADQTIGAGQDNYVLTYDHSAGTISLEAASGGGGGISNVVEDTTPQLGGNLDVNGNSIVSVTNGNITLAPDGTGVVQVNDQLVVGSSSTALGTTTIYGHNASSKTFVAQAASGQVVAAIRAEKSDNSPIFEAYGNGYVGINTTGGAGNTADELLYVRNGNIRLTSLYKLRWVNTSESYFSAKANTGDAYVDCFADGTQAFRAHHTGALTINGSTSLATATIYGHSASDEALLIKAASAQTADLVEIQNNSGTKIFSINSDGSTLNLASSNGVIAHTGNLFYVRRGTSNAKAFSMDVFGSNGFRVSESEHIGFADFTSGVSGAANTTIRRIADAHLAINGASATDTCQVTVGSNTSLGTLTIYGHSASDEALVIKAASSQSADILQIQNSGGTELVTVDSSGKLGVNSASPNATLTVNGSMSLPIESISATDTLDDTNHTVLVDANLGDITVNLPAASGSTGKIFIIKKTDSSSNNVIIDPNAAETIDGSSTFSFNSQYRSVTIQCDGSNWWIISSYIVNY